MVLAEEKRRIKNALDVQRDLFALSTEELGMKYGSTEGAINFIDGLNELINSCSFSYFYDTLGNRLTKTLQSAWLITLVDPSIDKATQERIEDECQRLYSYGRKNELELKHQGAFHEEMRNQYEGIRCDYYGLNGTTHDLSGLFKSLPTLFDAIVTGRYQAADAWYANGVAYLSYNYPGFMDSLSDTRKESIRRIIDRRTIRRTSEFFTETERRDLRVASRAARKNFKNIPKTLERRLTKTN